MISLLLLRLGSIDVTWNNYRIVLNENKYLKLTLINANKKA